MRLSDHHMLLLPPESQAVYVCVRARERESLLGSILNDGWSRASPAGSD
jgi:hypothetical protein